MRSAGGLLAAHQDVVVGLEEQQRRTPRGQRLGQLLAQGVEEDARADVDHDRDRLVDALLLVDEADDGADQLGRQVVDDVVAEVLELLGRGAAPGTGHARDDHELALVWTHDSLLDLTCGGVHRHRLRLGRHGLGDRGRGAQPDARHLRDLLDGGSPEPLE